MVCVSKSNWNSLNNFKKCAPSKLNSASTIHFKELFLILFKSALLPKTKAKAPNIIDFPAPVSPVIDVNPELNSTQISSIRAKFFMESLEINKAKLDLLQNSFQPLRYYKKLLF